VRWLCVAHEKEIPDFHGLKNADVSTWALGVGNFASLARFAELVALEKPDSVVLAGTAGSPRAEDVNQLFACNHFAFPSIDDEELPEFLPRVIETHPSLIQQTLRAATILQNQGISLDSEKFSANTKYIPSGYPAPYLENMEATSLAMHCKKHAIPFTAIVCVTNVIGPNGRNDWKKNFQAAGVKLRAFFEK